MQNNSIAKQIAEKGGVEAYLKAQQYKGLLRFLTCGSVDDGKARLSAAYYMTRARFTKTSYLLSITTVNGMEHRGKSSTLPYWSMAYRRNGNKASPLMSPIAISRLKSGSSSSPILRVMNNIPQYGDRRFNLRPRGFID